jgi:hypothetical protein
VAAGCRRCCAKFLYVFEAARNGPHAPPPGRASDAPLSLHAGHAERPAAGAEAGKARRAAEDDRAVYGLTVVGRQPAGAAPGRRGVGQRTPGPDTRGELGRVVAVTAPPAGALRLQDGRRPPAGRGPWVVARSHPVCRRPGQAEQTTARPASVRTCVKVRLTWRAGRRPAPRCAGRRQTGWQEGWC